MNDRDEIKDIVKFTKKELKERIKYLEALKAHEKSWLEMLLVRAYQLGKEEGEQ